NDALARSFLECFPGGRFEQFIPSRPLTCLEISKPAIGRIIAPMLARVHTLDVPITKEPVHYLDVPSTKSQKWMTCARCLEGNILLCDECKLNDDGCIKRPNDGNHEADPLVFIDFEYCSYNY
ncbi:hypothetical protein OSTOST_24310, partial [Ostertagia ostertagi]